jgi:hypothetical protein
MYFYFMKNDVLFYLYSEKWGRKGIDRIVPLTLCILAVPETMTVLLERSMRSKSHFDKWARL